jgi:hypothetical protein
MKDVLKYIFFITIRMPRFVRSKPTQIENVWPLLSSKHRRSEQMFVWPLPPNISYVPSSLNIYKLSLKALISPDQSNKLVFISKLARGRSMRLVRS